MERVGFRLKVQTDRIDEYRERHKRVWPEMQEALRRHGWHNYSLFLDSDGTLFGYVEVPTTFQDALAGMDREDVNNRWQAYMQGFFEILPGLRADQAMVQLEQVFFLD